MLKIKTTVNRIFIEVLQDIDNLSGQKLTGKSWSCANLSQVDMEGVAIINSKLESAVFDGNNLSHSYIEDSDFQCASLQHTKLTNSKFIKANFTLANFAGADLTGTVFTDCILNYTSFVGADLSKVRFVNTIVDKADLSEAILDYNPEQFLKDNFEHTKEGILGYKIFGLYKPSPATWVIKPGSIITENVCRDIFNLCAHGINIYTKPACQNVQRYYCNCESIVWELLVRYEWFTSLIVPYEYVSAHHRTIRAGKALLLNPIQFHYNL